MTTTTSKKTVMATDDAKEERKLDNAKTPHEFIVQELDEKSQSYYEAGTVELVRYIPEIEQSYVWHLSPEEIDRLSNALGRLRRTDK